MAPGGRHDANRAKHWSTAPPQAPTFCMVHESPVAAHFVLRSPTLLDLGQALSLMNPASASQLSVQNIHDRPLWFCRLPADHSSALLRDCLCWMDRNGKAVRRLALASSHLTHSPVASPCSLQFRPTPPSLCPRWPVCDVACSLMECGRDFPARCARLRSAHPPLCSLVCHRAVRKIISWHLAPGEDSHPNPKLNLRVRPASRRAVLTRLGRQI